MFFQDRFKPKFFCKNQKNFLKKRTIYEKFFGQLLHNSNRRVFCTLRSKGRQIKCDCNSGCSTQNCSLRLVRSFLDLIRFKTGLVLWGSFYVQSFYPNQNNFLKKLTIYEKFLTDTSSTRKAEEFLYS